MSRWRIAARTFWNNQTYREVRDLIRRERPQVVHCTNTFPLMSPSVYYAAHEEGVPVVQALRNYRLLCANGLLLRDGAVCEDCVGRRSTWRSIVHGCYRESRGASAVVTAMLALHRRLGAYGRMIDRFYTLTEFAKSRFVRAGAPADKIDVKPNFIDPAPLPGTASGDYAIFVGRLSAEKGIACLLDAWRQAPPSLPLVIVGDGPLRETVQAAAKQRPDIRWLDQQPHERVLDLIGEARLLVMPSIWYETFGRTLIEAFAKGTPVLASHIGAMSEIVSEGETGMLFEPGNTGDLVAKLQAMIGDSHGLSEMRRAARARYETWFTADINYRVLMEIYGRALKGSPAAASSGISDSDAAEGLLPRRVETPSAF
jgi:glycosyltransferase involved in cell wall biosynthesis